MMQGWTFEFLICMMLCYCRPINYVFGTRDLAFLHFGIYSSIMTSILIFYDELRKYLIRNYPP